MDGVDWKALERLRRNFLDGTAGGADYWHSDSDLASYDATFAQRIGWKWDYVLTELNQRGWTPPNGDLVDWGCGSGIAHRAFLDHFGTRSIHRLLLVDRSPRALDYAARRARSKYPGLHVESAPAAALLDQAPDAWRHRTVLISHLLTELPPDDLTRLADTAGHATAILWVEPGTYEASLNLIAVRERLRHRRHVVAPCTHQEPCGILAPANERHWCHHFAPPPPAVFTDGNWARFAQLAGIDLRSLPLSFLVLDARPPSPPPAHAGRRIGHPRLYKAHALILGCDATGVRELRLEKRDHPGAFRSLRKESLPSLLAWREESGRLAAVEVWPTSPPPDAG